MVQRVVLRVAIAVVVVGAVVAGAIVFTHSRSDSNYTAAGPVAPTTVVPASTVGRQPVAFPQVPPPPPVYEAADAVTPSVDYFSSPGDVTPAGAMPNPTINSGPLVFRVLAHQGDWLQVQVSKRPNGFSAWIHRSDVALRPVPNHVVVELGARRLTVYHDNNVLMQETVAIGKPSAPTPTGSFFIEGSYPTGNPGGAYGVLILVVSAFSDVYQTFAGGIGEIGIHGTNAPSLLGQAVSHGCVRMPNDAVTHLGELAPPGTTVDIVA